MKTLRKVDNTKKKEWGWKRRKLCVCVLGGGGRGAGVAVSAVRKWVLGAEKFPRAWYRYDVSRKTSDSATRDCCPSLSEVIESGEEAVIWGGERVVVIKGSATREVIPSTLTATR